MIEQSSGTALRTLPLHLDETATALGLAGVRAATGVKDFDLRARVGARAIQCQSLAGVVKLTRRLGLDAGRDVRLPAEDGPADRDAVA